MARTSLDGRTAEQSAGRERDGELYFCGSEIVMSGENKDPQSNKVLSDESYALINKPVPEAMF